MFFNSLFLVLLIARLSSLYAMKKLFSSLKKAGVDPKAVKTIYTASCTLLQLLFFPKFIAVGLEESVLKHPNSCIFFFVFGRCGEV